MTIIDNLRNQGATIRVKNRDNTEANPVETLTISSWVVKLRKAETEAINNVTREITSIVQFH
jgi:hypothetical protein